MRLQESRVFLAPADSPNLKGDSPLLRGRGEELAIDLYEAYRESPRPVAFISLIRLWKIEGVCFYCLLTHRPEFREVVDRRYEGQMNLYEKHWEGKLAKDEQVFFEERALRHTQKFRELEKNFEIEIKYGAGEFYHPVQFAFDPSGSITIELMNLTDPVVKVEHDYEMLTSTSRFLHFVASDQIHKGRGIMPVHFLDDIDIHPELARVMIGKSNSELSKALSALKTGDFRYENIWCSISNPEEWHYRE